MPSQENSTGIVIQDFFRKGRMNGKSSIVSAVEWTQELVAALQLNGYEFKDLLLALSRLVAIEGVEDCDRNPKWFSVAGRLERAANAFRETPKELSGEIVKASSGHRLREHFQAQIESSREYALMKLIEKDMRSMEDEKVRLSDVLIALSISLGYRLRKKL